MPEITRDELQRVREWCRTYGPANCWTGTGGAVAATVLKLIQAYEERESTDGQLPLFAEEA